MALRDVQEKSRVFEKTNDVLCFGLSDSELDYLRMIGAEPALVDVVSRPGELNTKFNVMVLAVNMSVFRIFGVIERYMGSLLSHGKIAVRLEADAGLEDTKNVVAQLSRPLKLQPEMYVDAGDGEVWLVLTRI